MQKIKISIGDRVYPLSVTEGQEAFLRDSAKQIEKMMKHYEQNYAVQDKQDVLAMCALQLALQLRQEGKKSSENTDEIENSLQNSNKKIKPETMVFKPKISKNDYNQKI